MSLLEDIRDLREGRIRSDIGDGIVRIESLIVGAICFFLLWGNGKSGTFSLTVGLIIAILIPILMGFVKVFAWIATIFFSLIWGIVGFYIGGALLDESVIAGIIIGIVVFCASFFAHRVFAGLGFVSVEKQTMDAISEIRDNTANIGQNISEKICSSCNTRLDLSASFCNKCGTKQ